ncbi:hypothetical protein I302_103072 [Kwoniella bestiolae CBS 10118]|uniref:Uncharacterized protein n=1 Tax=Kwoniella bestiolae CBS 10118 TaxID=1296100 RepID=A0A1B9GGR4_9TREE|nr:hypothetical protein I302_01771 [Kwoniella bestiolae CBS 10118]OCF30252.1 hypothetical protein I302_01771 [Kwoniella bestiolae CBS 10118]
MTVSTQRSFLADKSSQDSCDRDGTLGDPPSIDGPKHLFKEGIERAKEALKTDQERQMYPLLAGLYGIASTLVSSFENGTLNWTDGDFHRSFSSKYRCKSRRTSDSLADSPSGREPEPRQPKYAYDLALEALASAVSAGGFSDPASPVQVTLPQGFEGYLHDLTPEAKRELDDDITGQWDIVVFASCYSY